MSAALAKMERLVERLDPSLLVPTSTVVVHVAAEDLPHHEGVCRVPGIGPTLKSVVGEWLGHDRVVVRPVIMKSRELRMGSHGCAKGCGRCCA